MQFKKGDNVIITDNEIFGYMGYSKVSGIIISLHADGSGFSFKCNETRSIEGVSLNDGIIRKVN